MVNHAPWKWCPIQKITALHRAAQDMETMIILSISRGFVWMVVLQGDLSHKANVGTGFMSRFAYMHVEVYMHAEKVC